MIKIYRNILSLILLLYFLLVFILEELTNNPILLLVFYGVFFCGIILNICCNVSHLWKPFIFIVGAFLLGTISYFINRNISILSYLYLVFGICISMIFVDRRIKSDLLIYLLLVNVILLIFLMYQKGLDNQLMPDHSNNYVSVYLLMPLCLYYTRVDLYKENYHIYPAIIVAVLSILSGGRGGFISSIFILIALVMCKLFSGKSFVKKMRVLFILSLIVVIIAIPLISSFIDNNASLDLINRFNRKGMTSFGRLNIWEEYLNSCKNNVLYLLFGSNIQNLKWASFFEGNLHNSFLFVHAYTGLIGLLFILIASIRAYIYALRNHKWIYFSVLLALEFRSFTDHVFGANRLTAIFLAVLLAPDLIKMLSRHNYTKMKLKRIRNN